MCVRLCVSVSNVIQKHRKDLVQIVRVHGTRTMSYGSPRSRGLDPWALRGQLNVSSRHPGFPRGQMNVSSTKMRKKVKQAHKDKHKVKVGYICTHSTHTRTHTPSQSASMGQSGHAPIRSSSQQCTKTKIRTKSVVNRRVKMVIKCAGALRSARTPLRELTALPRRLAGLRGVGKR